MLFSKTLREKQKMLVTTMFSIQSKTETIIVAKLILSFVCFCLFIVATSCSSKQCPQMTIIF